MTSPDETAFAVRAPSVRAAVAAVLMLALLGPPVAAEDGPFADFADNEVPIGVIETPPDRLVPRTSALDTENRSSDQLFAAAMDELKAARFDEAQRLFEFFVARDPKHPDAQEARKHLAELYQRDAAPPAAAAVLELPEAGAHGPAAALTPLPAARRVTLSVPVQGALESKFMLEAGDRVFFSARSADLGSRARAVLAAQARWLKKYPHLSAVIEGHGDDAALSAAERDALSAERAQAVYNRLIEEGVAAQRLAISPLGAAKPVAACEQPECSAQNRRAVTVLTPQRLSELPTQLGGDFVPTR